MFKSRVNNLKMLMGMQLLLSLNNSKVWKLVFANLSCGSACWNNVSN